MTEEQENIIRIENKISNEFYAHVRLLKGSERQTLINSWRKELDVLRSAYDALRDE